jgi:hypothetical protein
MLLCEGMVFQHGADVVLREGSGGNAKHLGYVALYIFLSQQSRGAILMEELIKAGERQLLDEFLTGGCEKGYGAIGGVATGG